MKRDYYNEVKELWFMENMTKTKFNNVMNAIAKSDAGYRIEAYGVNEVAYEIYNCDCYAAKTPSKIAEAYMECLIDGLIY